MPHTLELRLFGHPELRLDGQPLDLKLPHKALALLYYLSLTPQLVGRETLATLLWPDAPAPTAKQSLRNVLLQLRKALGDALEITHRTVALQAGHIHHIDVVAFQQGVTAMQQAQRRGHPPDLALWQATLDLYRGDFLAGFYIHQSEPFEEWTTLRRDHLRKQLVANLLTLSDAYAANATAEAALVCLDRLLEIEPENEAAYTRQIQLLLTLGRRTEARQRYERYQKMLADDFNLPPSPVLTALLTEWSPPAKVTVLQRTPGMSTQQSGVTGALQRSPALPSAPHQSARPAIPTNLSRPLSAFVGRSQEVAYLCRRLTDDGCRLLTIVGPGGMGKTSLAQEAGLRILQANQADFPDGVYFVALAGLEPEASREQDGAKDGAQTGASIVTAIAERIGCDLQSGVAPQYQLQNHLRGRRLLLILDNFEQLLAATDTVHTLLIQAPTLTMLVTSRARLNLRGEVVLTLDKLSLPASQATRPRSGQADLAQVSEAVAMFVQRAQCLDPHFTLNSTNADQVLRICQLVDGLPLGIELATSMLPLLSCADLAQELAQGLAFLQAETRDLPAGQRTLLAVFERSWRLLAPQEQTLLAKLSIFPTTFHWAAVQVIADAAPPLLMRLINQSLVSTTPDGRYAMHPSVRAFALEKLEQAPAQGDTLRVAFARFYLDFLAHREVALKSSGAAAATAQVYTELDNIRVAWRWAAKYQLHAAQLASMQALFLFYEIQGLLTEALEQAESGLQQVLVGDEVQSNPDDPTVNLLIGRLQTYLGYANQRIGRVAQADDAFSTSLARLKQVDSPFATALCMTIWGSGLRGRDIQQSRLLLSEAVRQVDAIDDDWLNCLAKLCLGEVNHLLGNYPEATAQYHKVYATSQQSDCAWGIAHSQRLLGRLQLALGHYQVAESHLRNCIAYAQQQNMKTVWVEAGIHLGEALRLQGRVDEAQQCYRDSRQQAEAIHHQYLIAQAIWAQGCLTEQCGEYAEARALFSKSMAASHPNLWPHLPPTLGWALIRLGELDEAHRYFSRIVAEPQARQFPPITLEAQAGLAYIAALRRSHVQESFDTAEPVATSFQRVYCHPAATQETRNRVVKLAATLGVPLLDAISI